MTWGWVPCGARRQSVGTGRKWLGTRGTPSPKTKTKMEPQKIGRVGIGRRFFRPVQRGCFLASFFVYCGGVKCWLVFLKAKERSAKAWWIYISIHDVVIMAAEYILCMLHIYTHVKLLKCDEDMMMVRYWLWICAKNIWRYFYIGAKREDESKVSKIQHKTH